MSTEQIAKYKRLGFLVAQLPLFARPEGQNAFYADPPDLIERRAQTEGFFTGLWRGTKAIFSNAADWWDQSIASIGNTKFMQRLLPEQPGLLEPMPADFTKEQARLNAERAARQAELDRRKAEGNANAAELAKLELLVQEIDAQEKLLLPVEKRIELLKEEIQLLKEKPTSTVEETLKNDLAAVKLQVQLQAMTKATDATAKQVPMTYPNIGSLSQIGGFIGGSLSMINPNLRVSENQLAELRRINDGIGRVVENTRPRNDSGFDPSGWL